MTPDTPPASVADLVHDAERLRMELLDALRREDKAQAVGVRTEMVMLYGQAFAAVYEACIAGPSREPLKVKVMHECVCGLAVYHAWLTSETPINPAEDSRRMTGHWRKVTGWVLGEDE